MYNNTGQGLLHIAYFENEDIKVIKDIGLVDQVFEYGKKVSNLPKSNFASGQVRYGTVNHLKYGDEARGAQPIHKSINGFNFVLSHNGELSNYYEIMQELEKRLRIQRSKSIKIIKGGLMVIETARRTGQSAIIWKKDKTAIDSSQYAKLNIAKEANSSLFSKIIGSQKYIFEKFINSKYISLKFRLVS